MQAIRKCKTCEEVNILNSIESSQVILLGGQSIRILYYDCHKCGKRNVVQIDDNNTLQLFGELKRIILAKRKFRKNGKNIYKKKYEEKRQSLVDARMALAKKVNGIIATYEDGKIEKLEVGDLYVEENKM